ncbi:MAG: hypothetical protein LUC16_02965 [Coprobacillus sp.]|nr:hypothetical protein [Coprobacillus sp.]
MSSTVIILIAVIVAAAVIAVVAYIIYRAVNPRLKDDGKPSDEEIAEEELNRVLSPVEDEETILAMSEYDKKLQEEENGVSSEEQKESKEEQ